MRVRGHFAFLLALAAAFLSGVVWFFATSWFNSPIPAMQADAEQGSAPPADRTADFSPVVPGPIRENSLGLKLVLLPAGRFRAGRDEPLAALQEAMGVPPAARDKPWTQFPSEIPSQRIVLTRPFEISLHETTRGQFGRFVEATGYQTDAQREGKAWGYVAELKKFEERSEFSWENPGFPQDDDHPVVNVSHNDAVAFCEWISRVEGRRYALPSEAQWEYACRAGTQTRWYFGDNIEQLAENGNVADAAWKREFPWWEYTIDSGDGTVFTAPVGRYRPNSLGLFDLCGNVGEWCADGANRSYDAATPATDPEGPADSEARVVRGGGFHSHVYITRSAARNADARNYRVYDIGFRVVCLP